jgi:hypothetical protein
VAQGQDDRPEAALLPGHVLSNRAKLQLEGRTRDLALFNLAIDSKLRGCDLFALRVQDVAPNGYATDRANVRQRMTGPRLHRATAHIRSGTTRASPSIPATRSRNARHPIAVD